MGVPVSTAALTCAETPPRLVLKLSCDCQVLVSSCVRRVATASQGGTCSWKGPQVGWGLSMTPAGVAAGCFYVGAHQRGGCLVLLLEHTSEVVAGRY
jgi:hypothetical protein